jgi:lipopolysaccharide transport system ATP-binding protein
LISGKIVLSEQFVDSLIQIDIEIFSQEADRVALEVRLTDALGTPIAFGAIGTLNPDEIIDLEIGTNAISFYLPINQLALGKYFISLDLTRPGIEYCDRLENCLVYEVNRMPIRGRTRVLSQEAGCGCFELDLKVNTDGNYILNSYRPALVAE